MRSRALTLGLCFIAIVVPSTATAAPLIFTCKPAGRSLESFSVSVDVPGHRAKAHVLSFPDDQIGFSAATITADTVTWQVPEPKEQLTNTYTLDRNTGAFRQLQVGWHGGNATYSFSCERATKLF